MWWRSGNDKKQQQQIIKKKQTHTKKNIFAISVLKLNINKIESKEIFSKVVHNCSISTSISNCNKNSNEMIV